MGIENKGWNAPQILDHCTTPHSGILFPFITRPFEPQDLVTLEGLVLSYIWEITALVEVLERKGLLPYLRRKLRVPVLHSRLLQRVDKAVGFQFFFAIRVGLR